MRLCLSFLGPFQVTLEDKPAIFATDRARALLAYLAVEADRPHRREALAALLWPDRPEPIARRSLSQALVRLRRAIDDYHASPPFLLITGKTIQFDAATAKLDVARFETLLATCDNHAHHPDIVNCPACIERLEEAAKLYRGSFLQGLFLTDSQPFEEWALFKQEQLHRQALYVLGALAAYYQGRGEYEQMERYAERQLALEPWREEAHRQLMQALAMGKQRTAALVQYETCCRLLADELGTHPDPETTALYERIQRGELTRAEDRVSLTPTLARPIPLLAAQRATPRHNLPPQTMPFVGREAELAQLARWLADPGVRLVTVLGPGGIGKTRLAIEAAQAQVDAFAHGVRYVPLAPVDPTIFGGAIDPLIAVLSDALDFAFRGGDAPWDQLRAFLQDKEMLLVLDDFEHLLETVDFVSGLLSHAPQLKILVTSRQRLNLREEWVFSLSGMRMPAEVESKTSEVTVSSGPAIGTWEEMATFDAIQLFSQHARRVQPHFDPSAEVACVARICHLVDGMPLGIELAAAWLRLMPCKTIVQEIETNVDFLVTTLRNVPERHRSLRAVFDQSWNLLSEAEQAVLKKLSVFRGGFQRNAAEAVTGALLPQLSGLVDKSLLLVTPTGRYQIHELTRQYAAQKLRETPGEYGHTRGLHSLIYLDFLRGQEARLKGAHLRQARQAIAVEIDNIRTAWRWALERDQLMELKSAMNTLWYFYEVKGWIFEADDDFGQAVTSLRRHCQGLATSDLATPLADSCPILGQALVYKGWFQFRLDHFEEARALFEEGLAILRPLGNRAQPETAYALLFFGLGTLYFRGDPAAAISLLQESLILFTQIDDPWGKGTAMSFLGQATLTLGQVVEAERLLQESIALLTRTGNQRELKYAMSALGHIAQMRGQTGQAEVIYRECHQIQMEIEDQTGMAFSLCDLGEVARLQGAYDQADAYYQQSLVKAKETGLHTVHVQALRGLGNLAEKQGDYAAAQTFFQESLELSKTRGLHDQAPSAMTGLGWAALGLGEYRQARQHFQQALQQDGAARRPANTLEAMIGLAYHLAWVGQVERACELLAVTGQHPALTQESKNRAASLAAQLATQLTPQEIATAQARAQGRTLEEVVAQMLRENGVE